MKKLSPVILWLFAIGSPALGLVYEPVPKEKRVFQVRCVLNYGHEYIALAGPRVFGTYLFDLNKKQVQHLSLPKDAFKREAITPERIWGVSQITQVTPQRITAKKEFNRGVVHVDIFDRDKMTITWESYQNGKFQERRTRICAETRIGD